MVLWTGARLSFNTCFNSKKQFFRRLQRLTANWTYSHPERGGGVDSALLSMFAPLIFQTFHHFTKQAHLLGGALNLLMYFYSQLSGDQNDVVNFEWFLMSFYFLGLERKVVTLIPTIARFRVKSGFFSQGIHHFHFFVKWQDLVLLQICWEGGTYLGIPLFFHFYGDQSNSLCLC